MGKLGSWYFERLFHSRTSPDTKLAFIKIIFSVRVYHPSNS